MSSSSSDFEVSNESSDEFVNEEKPKKKKPVPKSPPSKAKSTKSKTSKSKATNKQDDESPSSNPGKPTNVSPSTTQRTSLSSNKSKLLGLPRRVGISKSQLKH